MVAVEPVPPQLLAELMEVPVGAGRGGARRELAQSYERERPRLRAGPHRRRGPAADRTPTSRPTSSGSPTVRCRTGSPPPPSRRWPSWPTASPSPAVRSPPLRGVNVDGVSRLLEQRGYIEVVGHADGPGPAGAVRHHRPLLGTPRARLARAAPGGGGLPARPRGGRRTRPRPPVGARPRRRGGLRRRLTGERLQKVLARVGIGSRRACEELIAEGRVAWTARWPRSAGGSIRPTSRIEVDGALVPVAPELVYYLLNKPDDVITTADDPQGRPTVIDARAGRTPRLRRRPARSAYRGAADLDQRRRAVPAADPSVTRCGQGVRGRSRRGHARTGCAASAAPGRRAGRRASPPRRRWACCRPACCASSSTKDATARSAACARPSAIPFGVSCAPASGRCAT